MAAGIAYGAFLSLLVVAAVVDLRELRIPNGIVAAAVADWAVWRLCCCAGVAAGSPAPTAPAAGPGGLVSLAGESDGGVLAGLLGGAAAASAPSAAEGVAGALVLGGGLLAATLAYEALTGRRSMGGGDVKLMAAVGLFLGVGGGLVCLMAACLVSLLLSSVLPRLGWEPRAGSGRRPRAPRPSVPGARPRLVPCAPRASLRRRPRPSPRLVPRASRSSRPRSSPPVAARDVSRGARPASARGRGEGRAGSAVLSAPARRPRSPGGPTASRGRAPAGCRGRAGQGPRLSPSRLTAVPFGPGIAAGAHVVVALGVLLS